MRNLSRTFTVLLALPALAACTETRPAGSFAERDSSGVRIIESTEVAWSPEEAWRLGATPSLEIGVEEGEDVYQLHRVTGALRLSDGTIVVSNSGSSELRFYDAEGGFLRRAGGRGAGPGEFDEFSSMRVWQSPTGALVVSDNGNARVNLFEATGAFLTSVRLEPLPEVPRSWIWGVFGDGSWLAAAPEGGGRLSGAPGEVIQSSYRYLRYDANGQPLGDLAQLRSRPRYVHRMGEVTHYPFLPLTSEPLIVAHEASLFITLATDMELERRNLDGDLTALIRWDPSARRRVDEVYERYKRESLAEISDAQRRRLIHHYYEQDVQLPDFVPTYEAMAADADGNIWLCRYRLPWEDQSRWDIIEHSGRWLGTISTPLDLEVFQIGAEYVLGRHRDSLGVERVQLYSLMKP